jgi:hypothetical protein
MKCGVCGDNFGDGTFCISCGVSAEDSSSLEQINNPKPVPFASIRSWFSNNQAVIKRSSIAIGTLVVISLAQLYMIWGVGPEQTLDRYIASIRNGDIEALSDTSLYPDYEPSAYTMVDLRDADKSRDVSYQIEQVKNGLADAKISIAGRDYVLQLKSTVNFRFFFFISEWNVVNPAPKLRVFLDAAFDNPQEVLIPTQPDGIQINEFRKKYTGLGASATVLPGFYSAKIGALGFLENFSEQVFASTGVASLDLEPVIRDISTSDLGIASRKASEMVKSCIRVNCSKLPKLGEYDFNLWQRYTYSTYTSSRFNKSFKFNKCQGSGATVVSATEIRLLFSCNYTARGHLYVRYTYYRGWYSDYYYYWNFYDTKSLTMTSEVTIFTNEAYTKMSVGAARLP